MIAGEIGKPHGIRGDVYVLRISDDPHRFDPGSRLVHQNGRTLVVETARPHRDRFLVKFEGVSTRSDADALRGALYVPAAEARGLGEGEVWVHELTGCEVVDPMGTRLGTVDRVVAGTAHDLLEVTTPAGSRLVPLVKEIVVELDRMARRVVVDAPEGLLE